MFLLWHPSFTAINLSYTFPILETSATALCGTTGIYRQYCRCFTNTLCPYNLCICVYKYKYIYIRMDSLVYIHNEYLHTTGKTPHQEVLSDMICHSFRMQDFVISLWYFFAWPVHDKITTRLAVNVTSRHMAGPFLNGANLRLFPWGGQFHFGSSVFSLGQGQLEIFRFPDGPYGTAMI